MELKVKYQYTYFIKPFLIKENKYEKYLFSLLSNKNYKLKIFEKERDLNLYSYFIQNAREYFFPTFAFSKGNIRNLEEMDIKTKTKILSKFHCNIFEYKFDSKIEGKISDEKGIFFNISKVQLICFDSGICFFVIKTYIEDSERFTDLLNFNYKFKDINSDFSKLKDFSNIKIQTGKFSNMDELSEFIDKIIGTNSDIEELKNIDLYNKRFFVYSYCCIDQENWNNVTDFENLKTDFLKFSHALPSGKTIDFDLQEINNTIKNAEKFKYSAFGFTKQSMGLMTSNIDIYNYTKLPFEYENEYLYTLIICLYQRIYLKKLERDFKDKKDILKTRQNFSKFTKEIWMNEITNSSKGTIIYNQLKENFELEKIYVEIKNKYNVIYKELNIDKEKRANKIILIILAISIAFNIINFITLVNILK